MRNQLEKSREIHDTFNRLIVIKRVIKIVTNLVAEPMLMRESSYFRPSINEHKGSNFFKENSLEAEAGNGVSLLNATLTGNFS